MHCRRGSIQEDIQREYITRLRGRSLRALDWKPPNALMFTQSHLVPALLALLDIPPAHQPTLPWSEMASEDPLLPPKMLLRFLSEMAEPLISPELYSNVRQTKGIEM